MLNQNIFCIVRRFHLYPETVMGHMAENLLEREAVHPKLLKLARKNHELRPNAESKLLLARTYLKLNQAPRVRKLIEEILRTSWRTAETCRVFRELEYLERPSQNIFTESTQSKVPSGIDEIYMCTGERRG
jgi:hypothetical protein